MLKPTYDITIIYKNGATVTIKGFLKFKIDNGNAEWERGGPDQIMYLNVGEVQSLFEHQNPWYMNLAYTIWRAFK